MLAGAAAAFAITGIVVSLMSGGVADGDVAYARMMSIHHSQAVELSLRQALYGVDEDLRVIAVDALLTQQNQVGRFQQFMDERDVVSMLEPGTVMPGMIERADLEQFRTLNGAELDRRFVELMIVHHLGGVEMSRDALATGLSGEMERLARSVIASQSAEINSLRSIVARLP